MSNVTKVFRLFWVSDSSLLIISTDDPALKTSLIFVTNYAIIIKTRTVPSRDVRDIVFYIIQSLCYLNSRFYVLPCDFFWTSTWPNVTFQIGNLTFCLLQVWKIGPLFSRFSRTPWNPDEGQNVERNAKERVSLEDGGRQ